MLAYDVTDAVFATKGLVFRNISYPDIEILRNKATFITGGSGTGKTTLLRLFNQTATQTSGTIMFCGSDIGSLRATELRRKAVLCGQKVFLFDGTIRDNFDEFRRYRRLPALSDEDITRFLKICRLDHGPERDCGSMSGGEKARVFLAIHLSLGPVVLMLDEPTSALDNETAVAVMRNIKLYCTDNDITLIVISHDRTVVDSIADDVIELGGGKHG